MVAESGDTLRECKRCHGVLGPIDPRDPKRHSFCAWATDDDWRAVLLYITGLRAGHIDMGGE